MAYFRTSFEVPVPADRVFEYLADFRNAAAWDPGVASARKLTKGALAVGTRFELAARFLGRELPLRYAVVQLDPPARVVFESETPTLRAVDAVTLEKTARGTRVTWDASLALRGLLYLADLPLHLLFQRIGRRAAAGLERALRELA
jgi:carbon monoxide dehydrogenase subunit G